MPRVDADLPRADPHRLSARLMNSQLSPNLPRTTPTPLIVGLIGAAFALIGTMRMPYPYYTTMRFVVAGACVVLAVGAIARRQPIVVVPLAIAAIFFLFVKGLSKEAWTAIDLATAVGLAVLGVWLSRLPVHE